MLKALRFSRNLWTIFRIIDLTVFNKTAPLGFIVTLTSMSTVAAETTREICCIFSNENYKQDVTVRKSLTTKTLTLTVLEESRSFTQAN